jgi:NOL1/NOP2/fmu family ribosome biogenesis protein
LPFGEGIYLAPEITPDIRGLKVLRAGLRLGSFKKMRFEPDHALSHALRYEDALCAVNLDADSEEAKKYITGLTLSCDAHVKGWCLVCVEDLGLGWGKASSGVIKNHYPRGLRKML